jgi:glycine/D-amino acid oxidase-like deaminating enzyme/nitrite reductase/ring-hydroxylating ferredoxin subunit
VLELRCEKTVDCRMNSDAANHAGRLTSLWMATSTRPEFPPLAGEVQADICVVGAGIAGLTTAYLLTQARKSVVVVDDGPIISGETERTTAHLVNALDERYFELERLHGEDGARLAAESHSRAIDEIERIVRQERIDCDFERVDGYLFNTPGEDEDVFERELAATHRAGLVEVRRVDRAPLASFDTGPALHFPRQAQFHPLKYLSAVAQAIVRRGGRIYANTHAAKIQGGKSAYVETPGKFKVNCQTIVVATNTPVNDLLAVHTKQAAYRTYVIGAVVPSGSVPKVLYWDTADPYHYVRLQSERPGVEDTAGDILIIGGEDHKTGQAEGPEKRFARLEAWTRERFPMAGEIRFRWSGQVMEPVDGLAFIGRNPVDHDNVYVVTGDSGNGMTHGTIAGLLLRDLIIGKENPWAKIYSPSRVTLSAAKDFVRENANMAGQYFDWMTAGDVEKDRMIRPGTGATVRHGLKKIAVYRDLDGTFHECSAVCPHLGAIVSWNDAEKTWDCPAHGSRFDRLGKVMNGPANKNLHPVAEHVHKD